MYPTAPRMIMGTEEGDRGLVICRKQTVNATLNGKWRRLVRSLSPLFIPVPMICEALAVGLALLWFTHWFDAGKVLVTLGSLLFLLLSNTRISAMLIRPLERRYVPLRLTSLQVDSNTLHAVEFIVVLASGYSPDPRVDVTSRLAEDTVTRLAGAIRLYSEVHGCKLILSGGPPLQTDSMAKVALCLGVKQEDIILEPYSENTEQEAFSIAPAVGKAPFLLVTSASHMPRAMALFRGYGMKPIPSPTDFLAKQGRGGIWEDLCPSYYGLYEAEKAVYEYLGIAWQKLSNGICWEMPSRFIQLIISNLACCFQWVENQEPPETRSVSKRKSFF